VQIVDLERDQFKAVVKTRILCAAITERGRERGRILKRTENAPY
jgi:hypothetical protein